MVESCCYANRDIVRLQVSCSFTKRNLGIALVLVFSAVLANAQALDPRCSDRAAVGRFTCTIKQPEVRKRETLYPNVVFAPGDAVRVLASGCVQTGGFGDTWKSYVNPSGPNSDHLYHGLIRIPTATAGTSLIRVKDAIGRNMTVSGAGMPPSELVLHLGYEDDDYSNNGYDSHDNGTENQCRNVGPAQVSIVIVRTASGGLPPPTTDAFNFNLEWSEIGPGGLPLNPQWTWQRKNPGQIPSTGLCHNFSKAVPVSGFQVLVPDFADCTNQTDLSHVDTPDGFNAQVCGFGESNGFHGHVNWFAVTFDGRYGWGDHNTDDDYDVEFSEQNDGVGLLVNGRHTVHTEFDSDETIDHFNTTWWNAFHQAVDGRGAAAVALSDCENHRTVCDDARIAALQAAVNAPKMIDGKTVVTGLFGLDCEHNCKSELHPVYAVASNVHDDPQDDVWAMFVRNTGDEGYCSSHLWDAPFTTYTFRLPWRDGMGSVQALWGINQSQFEGTDGTSGPTVTYIPPPGPGTGVYVKFNLPLPTQTPLIDGALHLQWTAQTLVSRTGRSRQPAIAARAATPARSGVRSPILSGTQLISGSQLIVKEDDEAESRIGVAIRQLPVAQQNVIEKARTIAITRAALHALPAGPAAQKIAALPPVPRVAVRLGTKGAVATRKQQRDAAQMLSLCAATNNAPAGLPPAACKGTVRDHR